MSDAPFELTIRCGRFATRAAAEQEGNRILQDLKMLHLVDQPDACSVVVTHSEPEEKLPYSEYSIDELLPPDCP